MNWIQSRKRQKLKQYFRPKTGLIPESLTLDSLDLVHLSKPPRPSTVSSTSASKSRGSSITVDTRPGLDMMDREKEECVVPETVMSDSSSIGAGSRIIKDISSTVNVFAMDTTPVQAHSAGKSNRHIDESGADNAPADTPSKPTKRPLTPKLVQIEDIAQSLSNAKSLKTSNLSVHLAEQPEDKEWSAFFAFPEVSIVASQSVESTPTRGLSLAIDSSASNPVFDQENDAEQVRVEPEVLKRLDSPTLLSASIRQEDSLKERSSSICSSSELELLPPAGEVAERLSPDSFATSQNTPLSPNLYQNSFKDASQKSDLQIDLGLEENIMRIIDRGLDRIRADLLALLK